MARETREFVYTILEKRYRVWNIEQADAQVSEINTVPTPFKLSTLCATRHRCIGFDRTCLKFENYLFVIPTLSRSSLGDFVHVVTYFGLQVGL